MHAAARSCAIQNCLLHALGASNATVQHAASMHWAQRTNARSLTHKG
jgi:hypothetical protein